MFLSVRILLILCIFGFSAALGQSQDWPQWRGANRDAKISSKRLADRLPSGDLPRLWSVPVGPGYSGPTVAGSKVYLTDRGMAGGEGTEERILCFDTTTGKTIWQHQYEAPYTISYTAGPRAAVTIHEGKALAVGAMGHFKCLDAMTGTVIWQRDLASDYKARMPIWGITAAPLVFEDTVIQVAAGAGDSCLVALDLQTGKERWAFNQREGRLQRADTNSTGGPRCIGNLDRRERKRIGSVER